MRVGLLSVVLLTVGAWLIGGPAASADGLAASAVPGTPVAFADLPGIASDDLAAAFATFRTSCTALEQSLKPLRAAQPAPPELRAACAKALALSAPVDRAEAAAYFAGTFTPYRLTRPAFFTGYFEPVVEGSLTRTAAFTTPLLALPSTLVAAASGSVAMRRMTDGTLAPMPDRAAIETGALGGDAVPLVWLREPVNAFFIQVQGSARILLPDGSLRRLAYAGRNGYPYTSIGKVLVDTLHIPPETMGMADLRSWIEAHGQGPGDAGTALMRKNRSYVFFRFDDALPPNAGPVGAAGVSLTPLRSLAVDRTAWSYGLPFYVSADMPWSGGSATPLRRLMVAQDTGSAIVGAARADLFFGTGPAAAGRAGAIRHAGALFVLWPKPVDAQSRDAPKRDAKVAR